TSGTVTGIETPDAGLLPAVFVLEQNYPNPFNPRTTLRYRIRSAAPQRIVLRIYNLLGQEVRTLVDAIKPAGAYATTWDGRDRNGRQMASGVYLSHLQVGDQTQVRRMVLSK
ncbi:MAG: FlgD immunoglobulin-like domain containing protein, partial [bacterium]